MKLDNFELEKYKSYNLEHRSIKPSNLVGYKKKSLKKYVLTNNN